MGNQTALLASLSQRAYLTAVARGQWDGGFGPAVKHLYSEVDELTDAIHKGDWDWAIQEASDVLINALSILWALDANADAAVEAAMRKNEARMHG